MSATPAIPRHIPALDGIRGLAVLIVFLYHYGGGTHASSRAVQLYGFVNKGGWSGVTLFFVLSGFLITGILWDSYEDPHWFRKFFARRSLRIFPLYYLVMLLLIVSAFFAAHTAAILRAMWIPLLFLENMPRLLDVVNDMPTHFGIGHLWSIAVEEQFYLIWPWALYLLRRKRRNAQTLCLAVFVLSALCRLWIWHMSGNAADWERVLPVQAGALALGGWLALAFRGPEWPAVLRVAPMAGVLGLVGWLVSGFLSHDFMTAGQHMMTIGLPSISFFYAALVALALTPGRVARVFSWGWLRWLGGISYGVYVFHMLFVQDYADLAKKIVSPDHRMANLLVELVIAAVASVALAEISYRFYERPFLKLKRFFVPSAVKAHTFAPVSTLREVPAPRVASRRG